MQPIKIPKDEINKVKHGKNIDENEKIKIR